MLETERINEIAEISEEKDKLLEKQRYRRHLWQLFFLEFLLIKLQEKEQSDEFSEELPKREGNSRSVTVSATLSMQEPEAPFHGMGRDSLELTLDYLENLIASGNYAFLVSCVRRTCNLAGSQLLAEAGNMMGEYYAGNMGDRMFAVLFLQFCYAQLGKGVELGELYECFARANARKSVQANQNEGRMQVEACGLAWAGTTYYNAAYYYMWENVQNLLLQLCAELADDCGMEQLNPAGIERESRFRLDGGLDFHGVFEWIQRQNNFPSEQYGLKDKTKRPPDKLIYLYRNGYSTAEEKGICGLIQRIRNLMQERYGEEAFCRSVCIPESREYHNGISFLPDRMDDEEKTSYADAVDFIKNFRLYRISGCVELLMIENAKE